MTDKIPGTLLSQFSEFVETHMGLHFPEARWRDLASAASSAVLELGFDNSESSIQSLMTSPLTKTQIETLASHLTVGETYFFREKKSFEILEQHLLPELVRQRKDFDRRIRIWSAGCCTGEEPYSIAMVLSQIIPDWRDWNITILATDINPRFLQKASEAAYGEWSFRDIPPGVRERYFTRTKSSRFQVLPSIKHMVQFSYLNLADDAYPSLLNNTNAMDIFFCRNVLMYFIPERAKKVIQNFHRSLVDGGWLIVSPSETSQVLFTQFSTVNFPGAVLYSRDSKTPLRGPTADRYFPTQVGEEHVESALEFESQETPAANVEEPQPPEEKAKMFMDVRGLYERGFYAEAEKEIVHLLSHHRDDAYLMALLARVYANQGKLVEAQEWSQKANAADNLNPAYRYLLATILQERGQVEHAMASLKQALYLDQHFVLAYFALGNLAHRRGKSIEAKKQFQNALALLSSYRNEEIVPESEGITAARLTEIIRSITNG